MSKSNRHVGYCRILLAVDFVDQWITLVVVWCLWPATVQQLNRGLQSYSRIGPPCVQKYLITVTGKRMGPCKKPTKNRKENTNFIHLTHGLAMRWKSQCWLCRWHSCRHCGYKSLNFRPHGSKPGTF
jgi:hypothetical protein